MRFLKIINDKGPYFEYYVRKNNEWILDPNQKEIDEISASDLIPHFSSIISNQINFIGSSFGGINNYRDSRKNRSVHKFFSSSLFFWNV